MKEKLLRTIEIVISIFITLLMASCAVLGIVAVIFIVTALLTLKN